MNEKVRKVDQWCRGAKLYDTRELQGDTSCKSLEESYMDIFGTLFTHFKHSDLPTITGNALWLRILLYGHPPETQILQGLDIWKKELEFNENRNTSNIQYFYIVYSGRFIYNDGNGAADVMFTSVRF